MSQVIYKYVLEIKEKQYIHMPTGAHALSLQMQNDAPTLWCLVDTRADKCDRLIKMCGTGHADPFTIVNWKEEYIGTVQDGRLVWHYFWGNIMDRRDDNV